MDAEVSCGAVLARHARLGDEVYIMATTAGEKGNPYMEPEEYKKQKLAEAKIMAEKLGAKETICLDYPDGELEVNREVQLRIVDEIRRIQPDVVITHWNKATHPDHLNTALNVETAVQLCSSKWLKTRYPAMPHGVRLFYAENWEDPTDFQPNVVIKLEEEDIRIWQEAIRECEVIRGGTITNFKFAEFYLHQARCRGMTNYCEYAQCFYTNLKVKRDKLFLGV